MKHAMRMTPAEAALYAQDQPYYAKLHEIATAIGYGRAQQIIGELWDDFSQKAYGVPTGRGAMGVTAKDDRVRMPASAEVLANVVDLGNGMTRLDVWSLAWWHQLPAGRYTLSATAIREGTV